AQQEEYTAYLENAMNAINKWDTEHFQTNFKYFVTALDRDNITPETLTDKNFNLFSDCLYYGIAGYLLTPEELKINIIDFLNYDIENRPENMTLLGNLYMMGAGVSKDFEKARYLLEKADNLNNARAAYLLGNLYAFGQGVSRDYAKAREYYQKATDSGNLTGAVFLAMSYLNGDTFGLSKNVKKAIQIYKMALGFENALEYEKVSVMYNLGLVYQNKLSDKKEAEKWFQKACDIGYGFGADLSCGELKKSTK